MNEREILLTLNTERQLEYMRHTQLIGLESWMLIFLTQHLEEEIQALELDYEIIHPDQQAKYRSHLPPNLVPIVSFTMTGYYYYAPEDKHRVTTQLCELINYTLESTPYESRLAYAFIFLGKIKNL